MPWVAGCQARCADLDKRPAEVAAMFDALADRYDMMNDILSMGQVCLWRKRVQRILQARPGDWVLDLAAGIGTSSVIFAQSGVLAGYEGSFRDDESANWITKCRTASSAASMSVKCCTRSLET
jgi:ubiE/COQ5 methyltransferase family